ncbi:hypothetical protein ACFWPH_29060 [Nocardia sp. NPDC058499]|uniref:hypothetical protein n=1 Tax=Nocardia sp. NPDC058499 TaxID=3346530 RepID=UPI00365060EF
MLSVSTPGTTFLPDSGEAAALARELNDFSAELVAARPQQFGFFATLPMPLRPRPKPAGRWMFSAPTEWCYSAMPAAATSVPRRRTSCSACCDENDRDTSRSSSHRKATSTESALTDSTDLDSFDTGSSILRCSDPNGASIRLAPPW